MNRFWQIVFVLAVGIVFSLAYRPGYEEAGSLEMVAPPAASAASLSSGVSSALQHSVSKLERDIDALRQELRAVSAGAAKQTDIIRHGGDPEESLPASHDEELGAFEYQEQILADRLDLALVTSQSARNVEAEESLENAVVSLALEGTEVVGIECGDDFCRAELRHDDAESQMQAAEQIPFHSPFNTDGMIRFVEGNYGPETVIYVAHQGVQLSALSD